MDRRLHQQLDLIEDLEHQAQGEKLQRTYGDLFGKTLPPDWLEQAQQLPAVAEASSQAQALDAVQTTSPPLSLKAGAQLIAHKLRVPAASALLGFGLPLAVSGALSGWGEGVDRLMSLGPSFTLVGTLFAGAGLALMPWKRWNAWRKGHYFLRKRPAVEKQTWAGGSVVLLIALPFMAGWTQAALEGYRQIIPMAAQPFTTFAPARESVKTLLGVDKETPTIFAADSTTCQVFRSQIDNQDAQPTTNVGLILNKAQAITGYNQGCFTGAELFSRANAYHSRSVALSSPQIIPYPHWSEAIHHIQKDAAIDKRQWCSLTREWPANISVKDRNAACENLSDEVIEQPITLAQMGVNTPTAPR